jgi:hypothetical protein
MSLPIMAAKGHYAVVIGADAHPHSVQCRFLTGGEAAGDVRPPRHVYGGSDGPAGSSPMAEAVTRTARGAAIELPVASDVASLHKAGARRPEDDVAQRSAVLMTVPLLRIAKFQEWTISLRACPIGGQRQQAHHQHHSEKSHRSCSPPRTVANNSIPEK